jgi:hypothetical protein
MIEERDKTIQELREKYPIEEQVKFNEFNIADKLRENTELKVMYEELYEREKSILSKMIDVYEEIRGKTYDYYKFDYDKVLQKNEIEEYYLPRNPKVKKAKELIDRQEIKVKFFKICMNAMDRMYWNMRNYVEYDKRN